MRVMPFQKHDWFPAAGLEPRVDTFSFSGDFVQKVLVALNVSAARSADLHEGEAAVIGRVLLQEGLDPPEALENALGVIDAIDSDAEQSSFYPQLFAQRGALCAGTE